MYRTNRLLEVIRADEKRLCGDLVVPVPLHRQCKKERGFNQVDPFARPLAGLLRLPYRPVLLMRTGRPARRNICSMPRSAGTRFMARSL
jgi:predicted amidophosphoribosyltransferase